MSQSSSFKRRRFFTYFLLGAVLGCVLGYAMPFAFHLISPHVRLSAKPPLVIPKTLMLTLAGAFGGLAYAMRNNELQLPHKIENTLNPGWLADCLTGIAGAYVVFLILPIKEFNEVNDIEILATGIIGGYGGRSIMDQALDNLFKRQERLENKVEEKSQLTEAIKKQVQEVKQKDLSGAEAMDLLERYLDEDLGLPDDQLEQLKQVIKAASSSLQARIFLEGKKVLAQNLRDNNSQMIARTIPVFEALNDTENKAHRNYAQLGYAFEGKKEWKRADEELTKAIKLRNKVQDKNQSFRLYELHRAICRIKFEKQQSSPNLHDAIWWDLHNASRFTKAETRIKSNKEIEEWLAQNNLTFKDLEFPPYQTFSANGALPQT